MKEQHDITGADILAQTYPEPEWMAKKPFDKAALRWRMA